MKTIVIILALAVSLIPSGCASFLGPKMGSREYTPHSEQERAEFEKANRNVYPDDIRQDISQYKNTTIAWAGIIREVTTTDEKDHMEMIFLIEHHYYDWIEDIGTAYGTHWLSPRGEGNFKAKIGFAKDELAIREKWGAIKNMVIVYGTPHMVDNDGVIYINTAIVFFAGRNYTTRMLNYGRSEQPF